MTRLEFDGSELCKVLYIEDDRISVVLFQAMLAGLSNISLFLSDTAEDGIAIALRERPDFIFLDLNLPGMDGITALGILRADPRLQHSKFIGLSTTALADQRGSAGDAGFDSYITKPYMMEQVTSILNRPHTVNKS
jgi:CheY-like chemotaxis protein